MLFTLSLLAATALALDNGLVRTPPLGWMSWMYWETGSNEVLVKEVVDTFVSEGYAAARV
jgi:alpha-galactosidase